jgi:hypothetical protein
MGPVVSSGECFPRMFPTALNGPTGAWKVGIDVPEWAQWFFPENIFDYFEWARRTKQSWH